MKPSVHVTVSLIGGVVLGSVTGSWLAAACSVVSGVFVDLDHVLDYFLAGRKWKSSREFFFYWKYFPFEKLYLFLHGWEYPMVLGFLAWLGIYPAVTGGLAFGLLHHLSIDWIGNEIRPAGYLLLVRWRWNFLSRKIFVSWETRRKLKKRP